MTQSQRKNKRSNILKGLFGKTGVQAEKNRLEAFLNAVPGEYCGWSSDGEIAFSRGFPILLDITDINNLNDIQDALTPSDAAVLEGAFISLQEKEKSFSVKVQTASGSRTLKMTGVRGRDMENENIFDIIWLEDISDIQKEVKQLKAQCSEQDTELARLQAALEKVPLPLWLRDANTKIIWVNKAYADIVDSSMATIIAEQKDLPLKPVRKDRKKYVAELLAQAALDEATPQSIEGTIIYEGDRRLYEITEKPIGALNLTLGTAFDKSREEELEQEQKRYMTANKDLMEHLGTAIAIFNSDEKIEFYNSAFSQLWDLQEKFLNGAPKLGDIMETLRSERRLPEQADFRKFKQSWLSMFTSLLEPHEDMLYLPDGQALRMLVVPHSLGGLMMTFEDVTSRLELESSYNTLIAVQKETLDNLAEGVVVFGGDGCVKLWNPAFSRLWGFNPETLENNPHINKLSEKMKAHFDKADWPDWQKLIIAQSIDRNIREGQLERKDGSLIAYSTVPLPDGGVLVTHIDVTDKMNVENALREKNAALEAAEKLKLDFLANVSYQLRTPLNAITGFSDILGNEYFGPLNDKQKEYTDGLRQAGGKLASLIDDILDLSTIEAGYMELNIDNVAIKDIISSVDNVMSEWAKKDKIDIKISCPKNVGSIEGDERRLKQALLNLVRNAMTHSPEKGAIEINASRKDGSVKISVIDNGEGIPEEDQKRIFEPFEKTGNVLSNKKEARAGAGLGLTLVKNIINLHGGVVSLKSDKGKGTEFTIQVPVKREKK